MSLARLLPKNRKSVEQGAHAEGLAERWLRKQGLKILQRNYRCKCGEIDLIMQDDKTLVFIEVRQRTNRNYATGAETVTYSKQSKIIKTASHFLQKNSRMMENPVRFDVISVSRKLVNDGITQTPASNAQIDWIKNAFEVSY